MARWAAMWGRALLAAAAVLCAVVASACTGGPSPEAGPPGPPPPAAAPAMQEPVRVVVEHIEIVDMGNAEILGAAGTPASNEAVTAAVDSARQALEGYLNAQFVAPDSRFGAVALEGFVSPGVAAALTPEARAALGELRLWAADTSGGPATARAEVLVEQAVVHAVNLRFVARILAVGRDSGRAHTVEQHGDVVLVPTAEGWRAHALTVSLDTSRVPPRPLPPEAPAEALRRSEVIR